MKNKYCIRCGKETYKGKLYCNDCKKKNYMRDYMRSYRDKKNKITECKYCGSKENVMPFAGTCKKCYKIRKIIE